MINIQEVNYYDASELKKEDPIYFRGCRTAREFIKKKGIAEADYKCMMLSKSKGWYVSESSKAKILLTETWVNKNVPKYCPNVQNELKDAPPVMELKNKEKFTDAEGNALEIEVRGTKDINNCWFKAKDVEREFKMPSLRHTIIDIQKAYEIDVHYNYFGCKKMPNGHQTASKKEIFLTYKGMLKVLFGSRTKIADHFVDWATQTLFTIHLGTKEHKHKLIADLTGVDATSVKEVFKKSCDKFSCVYLFYLNTAKELRETMNIDKDIPDDHIIYKYGRTDDIARRTSEHQNTFANIKLKLFSYIDPIHVSNAERDISNFFNKYGVSINFQGSKEIVAVNPKDFEDVQKRYKSLFNEYGGRTKDVQLQLEELKHKIELKDKTIELKDKTIEMQQMELQHLKQVSELEKRVLQQEIIILKKN